MLGCEVHLFLFFPFCWGGDCEVALRGGEQRSNAAVLVPQKTVWLHRWTQEDEGDESWSHCLLSRAAAAASAPSLGPPPCSNSRNLFAVSSKITASLHTLCHLDLTAASYI